MTRNPFRITGILQALSMMGCLLVAAARNVAADEPAQGTMQVSLAAPTHLWNRIRSRFHVRVEDEVTHGRDTIDFEPNEHDPMHWSRIWFPRPVDYLLKGAPYQEAIALLDELLAKEHEHLDSDPLQRALFQHDLWAVFDYVSTPEWSNPLQLQRERFQQERRELSWRLALAIDRLALANEQIDKLPDNYAAAITAKRYPTQFDSQRPDQSFLPPDLWEPEGPWVQVSEWANNPLAIRHTAFFRGRSTFAVFLRLPGGRPATETYLRELRDWKPPAGESIPPNGKAIPPQVPPHTQFALARRMIAVNDAGELIPTRLTESVQIRVLPDGDAAQTFLEYRVRRQELAAGKGGGLSAVQQDERDRSDMLGLGPGNDEEKHEPILASCRRCHTDRGILSMNSYTGSMDNVSRLRGLRSLTEGSLKDQEEATIAWKQNEYSWGLLKGLNEGMSRD